MRESVFRVPCSGLPTCPYCIASRKAQGSFPGHRGFVSPRRPTLLLWSDVMKRPSPSPAAAPGKYVCPDATWAKHYPCITEGMCDPFWDDRKPREVWTLSIRMKESGVLLTLNDRNSNSGLYTEAEDVDSALALMEDALKQGTASWRRFPKK